MKKRSFAMCLMLALGVTALLAADFWKAKKFTEWSDKEVQKMLDDSPWAHKDALAMQGGGGMPGGGGGGGGRRGGGRGGMSFLPPQDEGGAAACPEAGVAEAGAEAAEAVETWEVDRLLHRLRSF